jgi:hypothetical protein
VRVGPCRQVRRRSDERYACWRSYQATASWIRLPCRASNRGERHHGGGYRPVRPRSRRPNDVLSLSFPAPISLGIDPQKRPPNWVYTAP